MPSKPKSKTSKNKLSQKAKVPAWVIVIGVLVLICLGAFFVYNSLAADNPDRPGIGGAVSGDNVYCSQGYCTYRVDHGNQHGKTCHNIGSKPARYLCYY